MLTAAVERTLKLLSPRFSGLSEGLVATEGSWQDGLSELGVAAQAITAEARLLAAPVSFELASTMQESGVEDRTALTSLGARRVSEMLDLGARVLAIELTWSRRRQSISAVRSSSDRERRWRTPPSASRDPLARLARADAAAARRARDVDPVRAGACVSTYDVHQHFWPEGFVAALRSRTSPRLSRRRTADDQEGRFEIALADHGLEGRLRTLDRDAIDVAVLSLQASLGLEVLSETERGALEEAWVDGTREVVAAAGGRLLAFSPSVRREGFVGVSLGSSALADLDRQRQCSTTRSRPPVSSSCTRTPAARPAEGRPDMVGMGRPATRRGCRRRTSAGSHSGGSAGRRCAVVFAMLAGGGPFQLERLARRGIDVRSALDPNTFFDVSTHGRRAIELCVETFGVGQLVYGSDTPVVDSRPTLDAVRGFGDAVAHVLQSDTPTRLLT